ncbi:MAG: bifunctional demethylmenaquinone methyltransferase/2-methoxy-6-polyprenyl-1,4-benzoquinol methylase UbiE [Bacteroidales bacterium]
MEKAKGAKESYTKEEREISRLFNNISPHYDRLNLLLSFGLDRYWRRVLVKRVVADGAERVADIACGTGDITIALAKRGVEAIGVDIAEEMIAIAEKKSRKRLEKRVKRGALAHFPKYILSSAQNIGLPSNHFHCATIAFGIRNFEKREDSLQEIARVIKERGKLYILEFSTPKRSPFKELYSFYFNKIVPIIGRIVSGNKGAYSYLPYSVAHFPQPAHFAEELHSAGFEEVKYSALTGGVAFLYQATKREAAKSEAAK